MVKYMISLLSQRVDTEAAFITIVSVVTAAFFGLMAAWAVVFIESVLP
jgi:hypothetical protein